MRRCELLRWLVGLCVACNLGAAHAVPPDTSSAGFLRRVVADHFVPQIAAFARTAPQLATSFGLLCDAPERGTLDAARKAWIDTMLSWEKASAIGFGPLLARRSVYRIDYWPSRADLIVRTLSDPPTTIKALELVGGPAKGMAATEWLLWTPAQSPEILTDPRRCAYAKLLALDIVDEAQSLDSAFAAFASSGLPEEAAGDALAALLNLALGALEQLADREMDGPSRVGNGKNFPRLLSKETLAAWNAQWSSIRGYLLGDGELQNDNLDSFLRARNFASVADKMRTAADRVTQTLQSMPNATPALALKAVKDIALLRTTLANDVAPALNIPIQFGKNDGD